MNRFKFASIVTGMIALTLLFPNNKEAVANEKTLLNAHKFIGSVTLADLEYWDWRITYPFSDRAARGQLETILTQNDCTTLITGRFTDEGWISAHGGWNVISDDQIRMGSLIDWRKVLEIKPYEKDKEVAIIGKNFEIIVVYPTKDITVRVAHAMDFIRAQCDEDAQLGF